MSSTRSKRKSAATAAKTATKKPKCDGDEPKAARSKSKLFQHAERDFNRVVAARSADKVVKSRLYETGIMVDSDEEDAMPLATLVSVAVPSAPRRYQKPARKQAKSKPASNSLSVVLKDSAERLREERKAYFEFLSDRGAVQSDSFKPQKQNEAETEIDSHEEFDRFLKRIQSAGDDDKSSDVAKSAKSAAVEREERLKERALELFNEIEHDLGEASDQDIRDLRFQRAEMLAKLELEFKPTVSIVFHRPARACHAENCAVAWNPCSLTRDGKPCEDPTDSGSWDCQCSGRVKSSCAYCDCPVPSSRALSPDVLKTLNMAAAAARDRFLGPSSRVEEPSPESLYGVASAEIAQFKSLYDSKSVDFKSFYDTKSASIDEDVSKASIPSWARAMTHTEIGLRTDMAIARAIGDVKMTNVASRVSPRLLSERNHPLLDAIEYYKLVETSHYQQLVEQDSGRAVQLAASRLSASRPAIAKWIENLAMFRAFHPTAVRDPVTLKSALENPVQLGWVTFDNAARVAKLAESIYESYGAISMLSVLRRRNGREFVETNRSSLVNMLYPLHDGFVDHDSSYGSHSDYQSVSHETINAFRNMAASLYLAIYYVSGILIPITRYTRAVGVNHDENQGFTYVHLGKEKADSKSAAAAAASKSTVEHRFRLRLARLSNSLEHSPKLWKLVMQVGGIDTDAYRPVRLFRPPENHSMDYEDPNGRKTKELYQPSVAKQMRCVAMIRFVYQCATRQLRRLPAGPADESSQISEAVRLWISKVIGGDRDYVQSVPSFRGRRMLERWVAMSIFSGRLVNSETLDTDQSCIERRCATAMKRFWNFSNSIGKLLRYRLDSSDRDSTCAAVPSLVGNTELSNELVDLLSFIQIRRRAAAGKASDEKQNESTRLLLSGKANASITDNDVNHIGIVAYLCGLSRLFVEELESVQSSSAQNAKPKPFACAPVAEHLSAYSAIRWAKIKTVASDAKLHEQLSAVAKKFIGNYNKIRVFGPNDDSAKKMSEFEAYSYQMGSYAVYHLVKAAVELLNKQLGPGIVYPSNGPSPSTGVESALDDLMVMHLFGPVWRNLATQVYARITDQLPTGDTRISARLEAQMNATTEGIELFTSSASDAWCRKADMRYGSIDFSAPPSYVL